MARPQLTGDLDGVLQHEVAKQTTQNPQKAKARGNDAPKTGEKWRPPVLADGFDLSEAKKSAYTLTKAYMDGMLAHEDMYVNLEEKDGDVIGVVKEKNSQRTLNRYAGVDLLKLYAQNFKERGIIVDGRV